MLDRAAGTCSRNEAVPSRRLSPADAADCARNIVGLLAGEWADRIRRCKSAELPTTGRRLAFARWLTGPDNPLTARVIANRVWMHHFGRGIVATPADFGRLGTPPSHPALLDWLAAELRDSGWSLKHLHRLIMLSTAYRQSSRREPAQMAIDAENRYYGRQNVVRLDAEALRDRALATTGALDRTLFGPPVGVKEDDSGQVVVAGDVQRRSLYVLQRRTQPVALMQAFDAPVMETNCEARPSSTVATQSLMLMNGEFWLGRAIALADRALREPTKDVPTPLVADLPRRWEAMPPLWQFGSGNCDGATGRTTSFTPLGHWTGSSCRRGHIARRTGWLGTAERRRRTPRHESRTCSDPPLDSTSRRRAYRCRNAWSWQF